MKVSKRLICLLLVLAMLASMGITTVFAADSTYIQDLEVDQRTTPMGIDNTTPEFRWEMVSDVRGQKQTAYQIVVKDGEEVVWDSGKVTSGISNAIPYGGTALESSTRYDWTVTVWDKDGNALESKSSWFEMGLLDQAADWEGASFIAPATPVASEVGDYTIEVDFRINNGAAGIAFGYADSKTYFMWQLSANSNYGYVRLCPHRVTNGSFYGLVSGGIDIRDLISWDTYATTTHRIKIEVIDNTIYTYIDGNKLDWSYTHDQVQYGQMGFRQYSTEYGVFDNIVVTDTEKGTVIYSTDFEDQVNPFGKGTLTDEDGNTTLHVTNIGTGAAAADVQTAGLGTSAPMFYKTFSVNSEKKLASARLYATSLGVYEAYINGEKVGDQKLAPGWTNYHDYIQYQTYDVTEMLKSGDNAIGAIVGEGWYAGHVSTGSNNEKKYGEDVAFIGQLVLTYDDGTVETIGTDTTWQAYLDGPYLETDNQDGETYDARKEVENWATTEMDTTAWLKTMEATMDTITTEVDTTTVALVAQPEDPAKVIEELNVEFLAKTGEDTYVYNVGQNISGLVRINVKGEAGTTVKLRFGEMVYKDTKELYVGNLRTAKATDYYTLKGEGTETYEPAFTFHGFQYVEVSGLGYQPDAKDITALVVHSELDRTGYIETNNALVNQLFSNVVWGQRDNYLSVPTDCPQRDERLGWTGDATTFSRTGAMNFDINAFYTKYLRDVSNTQREDGAIYDIAPAEGHGVYYGNHGWGDVAVVAPWTMYTAYGDTAVLEEHWEMMEAWMSYRITDAGDDYLAPADDNYGDWLAIEKPAKDITSTAYLAYVANLMAQMAEALDKAEDAAYYGEVFENVRTAFVDAYVNKDTGLISGNTQTAYAMAIYFDLIEDEALRDKVIAKFVAEIEASNWHLTTGFLGCELLLPALSEAGYSEVAYQLLLNTDYPSWLYPVVNGATTIWERWNSYIAETGTFGSEGMNSFNHYSYGSVAEWMYQYAAGIQYDTENAGYKHFTIAPNPSYQLNEFKAEYESVYGRIVSDWVLENDVFTLNVTVPANTTATIVVPSQDEAALSVNGSGATYMGTADNKATYEVESGTYTFTSTVKPATSVSVSLDSSFDTKAMADFTINGESIPYANVSEGDEVVVEAIPVNSAEWAFEKWTGDVESTENPLTIKVTEDTELTAMLTYVGSKNVALGKTVTATNNYSATGWSADNLTDGNYLSVSGDNGWTTGSITKDACDVSVQIDLGADITINELHLYPRTNSLAADGNPPSFPKDFTVSVSSNGSTWETVATVTDAVIPAVGKFYNVTFDSVTARYVKINVTKTSDRATDDGADRIQLCEIGVYNTNATPLDDTNNTLKMLIPYQSTVSVNSSNEDTVQAFIDEAKAAVAAYVEQGGKAEDLADLALIDGAEAAMVADALYQTDNYTIELTTTVVDGAQGFAFSIADTNNMLMWQLSTSATNTRLNPHVMSGGSWVKSTAYDISSIMGASADLEGKTVYERIEVNGTEIKTYMGFSADSMQLVNTYTHTAPATLLGIGARAYKPEIATYDNIVIKDGNGNLIYSEDFEDPTKVVITGDNAGAYAFEDGALRLGNTTLTQQRYIFGKASAFDTGVEIAEARIDAIGEAASRSAVEGAREAYDVLTDAQKAAVSNYALLTAAEEALAAAKIGDEIYYTVEEAVAAADADDIVVLVADSAETVNVAAGKTLNLDLNGKNLTKVVIAEGGKFYGLDSTTDNYKNNDSYGKIGAIEGDYAKNHRIVVDNAGKRYVAVTEEDNSISFHRFYVGITHMALRPGVGGAGYTMTLAGDEKVKSVMTTTAEDQKVYGYTVYVEGNEENGITCSGTAADFQCGIQKMEALTVDGILKTTNTADINEQNAETVICVEGFVMLNGEKVVTEEISMTFKDIVLATDAALNIDDLTDTQKAALLYLYNELGVEEMGWELVNIPELAK